MDTYNLRELREDFSIEFCAVHEAMRGICPCGHTATPEDGARFKRLKAAYVHVRYSMEYRIRARIWRAWPATSANCAPAPSAQCREDIAPLAAAATPLGPLMNAAPHCAGTSRRAVHAPAKPARAGGSHCACTSSKRCWLAGRRVQCR
jgi:hypothetical protein